MTGGSCEAWIEKTKDTKGYIVIHRELGQIGWEFYSMFFGEVIIDSAKNKGRISPATAGKLLAKLRALGLPRNSTDEDRESPKRPNAKPI